MILIDGVSPYLQIIQRLSQASLLKYTTGTQMDHRTLFILLPNVTLGFGKPYITDTVLDVLKKTLLDGIIISSVQLLNNKSLACIVVIYHELLAFLSSSQNESVEKIDWISPVSKDGEMAGINMDQLFHIVTCIGFILKDTYHFSKEEKVGLILIEINIVIMKNKNQNSNNLFFIGIDNFL